jgi:hypothetical protein
MGIFDTYAETPIDSIDMDEKEKEYLVATLTPTIDEESSKGDNEIKGYDEDEIEYDDSEIDSNVNDDNITDIEKLRDEIKYWGLKSELSEIKHNLFYHEAIRLEQISKCLKNVDSTLIQNSEFVKELLPSKHGLYSKTQVDEFMDTNNSTLKAGVISGCMVSVYMGLMVFGLMNKF